MNAYDSYDEYIYQTDIAEDIDSLDEIEKNMHNLDDSIEYLTKIRNAIEEFGISKPMMIIVDPNSELVSKHIVPSYENMSLEPSRGKDAEAAIEGLGSVISRIWEGICNFFKSIGKAIKDLWNKIFNRARSDGKSADKGAKRIDKLKNKILSDTPVNTCDYDKCLKATIALSVIGGKLTEIDIDKQLGSTLAKIRDAYSKPGFKLEDLKDEIVTSLATVVAVLKDITAKANFEDIGYIPSIDFKKDIFEMKRMGVSPIMPSASAAPASSYGWDAEKVHNSLQTSKTLNGMVIKLKNTTGKSAKLYTDMSKDLKKDKKIIKNINTNDRSLLFKIMGKLRSIMKLNTDMHNAFAVGVGRLAPILNRLEPLVVDKAADAKK